MDGKRLIQAKQLVQHGEWQAWLNDNFQLSQQTAQKFMKCSERFSNAVSMRDLSSTQMIALLSLPDAAETEKFLAEKAAEDKNVADLTIKQLREGQEIGKLVLLAEARLGEIFNLMPKAGVGRPKEIIRDASNNFTKSDETPKPKLEMARDMGFNKNQVALEKVHFRISLEKSETC